jgi:large subunit ribosomal protein L25
MTATFNLKANSREKVGSAESRRLRKAGLIPAIIHNKGGKAIYISVPVKELEHEYLKGNLFTTVAEIEVNGKKIKAVPHAVELNPVTDRPDHVDFTSYKTGATCD